MSALRVAFSGEPGAFAEDAVHAAFPVAETVALPGFRAVFEAVTTGAEGPGDVAVGIVPIENLVNGTVRETYDLLLEHDLVIRGEVVVPVRLCLAALPGESLESIERVYSHIQALGQAETFLRSRPWALLTSYNTAGAGRMIVERAEHGAAAVLSPRAAELFGLVVLAEAIEDVPDNRTRFIVVARPDGVVAPQGVGSPEMRTTLVFGVRNEPGTLLRVLRIFADAEINLSKLESRPARDRAWEYVFWVDLDADAAREPLRSALDELQASTAMLRVLGSYPRAAG